MTTCIHCCYFFHKFITISNHKLYINLSITLVHWLWLSSSRTKLSGSMRVPSAAPLRPQACWLRPLCWLLRAARAPGRWAPSAPACARGLPLPLPLAAGCWHRAASALRAAGARLGRAALLERPDPGLTVTSATGGGL